MPEFEIPTKSFVVSYTKRKGFRNSTGLTADIITMLEELIWIPRLGTVTPLEFDLSYGVTSLIASNERFEWYLVLVDVNNLPTQTGAFTQAIWSAAQAWTVDTAVGKRQVLSREVNDMFNPQSFSFHEVADFTQRLAVSLIAEFNQAETSFVLGVITWQETIIQRVFGGDSATFDESDSVWIDDFSDEEDGDYDD